MARTSAAAKKAAVAGAPSLDLGKAAAQNESTAFPALYKITSRCPIDLMLPPLQETLLKNVGVVIHEFKSESELRNFVTDAEVLADLNGWENIVELAPVSAGDGKEATPEG